MMKTFSKLNNFEVDFEQFLANHMYPPGYRKESAMTKMTLKHYDALVRAETCLLKTYDPNDTAVVRHEFDQDFLRIHDIKTLLLFSIYNPNLPYGRTDNDSDDTPRE